MLVYAYCRFSQRGQRDAAASIVFRKVFFELRGDRLERRFGLVHADPLLEPSNGKRIQESPVIEELFTKAGENLGVHAGGNPDLLGTGEGECSFKAFWRHADNRVGHGV